MSKVKIKGNASGTGVLTIEAPNTNTDSTITLPDGDVTLGVGIDDNATSTAITIDSSENVGVGTSSPNSYTGQTTLNINSAGVSRLDLDIGDTLQGFLLSESGYTGLFTPAGSNSLRFGTNNTERMRIDSTGSVGVGTSSPTAKLHVLGNNEAAAVKIIGGSTNGYYNLEVQNSASNGYGVAFKDGGSVVGSITTTGSATSYNTSSDYRLKENVVPMTGSIDRLKDLKPSRFNFKADADTTVDGFLAHEAQEVVPEAISGEKDAMRTEEYEVTPEVKETITIPAVEAQEERTEERVVTEAVMGEREVEDYQGIDQSKLVPLLVSALQEAIERIEQLENA